MKKKLNLLVCLVLALMASTVTVKAADLYAKVVIVPVSDNGGTGRVLATKNVSPTNYDKVYKVSEAGAWTTTGYGETFTSDVLEYPNSTSITINLYAQPKQDFSYFAGWYWDEDCTDPIKSTGTPAEYTKTKTNITAAPAGRIWGSKRLYTCTTEEGAAQPDSIITIYAKFSKVTEGYDWSKVAVTPMNGKQYYIYSPVFQRFIIAPTGTATAPTTTTNPLEATLFTCDSVDKGEDFSIYDDYYVSNTCSFKKCVFSYLDGSTTEYASSNGDSYWKNVSNPLSGYNYSILVWSWPSLQSNTFLLTKGYNQAPTSPNFSNTMELLSTLTFQYSAQTSASNRNSGIYWAFIPAGLFESMPQLNSPKENGTVTITTPQGTGTTYVTFNVSEGSFPEAFEYELSGDDASNWTLGTPTSPGTVLTVPVSYTATNKHTGIAPASPASTVTVTVTYGTKSISGTASAYVDLQPRFALKVSSLDWSHDGFDGEEVFFKGMEVAASQRDRLAGKLVYDEENTTGVAKNYATWTATITGTNADQFKFANGTQSVTGSYSAELLDVIYAPTTTGTHNATLHIVTSYTDGYSHTETYEQDIALSGKGSADSRIAFTAYGNVSPVKDETYNFGNVIGTNKVDVTADLLVQKITNPQLVWSDPAGVFEFDQTSVDWTKENQTLTFSAHSTTPVTANTVHTATLTISGKGTQNENISGSLTLTYTATPRLTPTVTWNWTNLNENMVATNPITTNSDGTVFLEKVSGDRVMYDAANKTLTVPYLHHEPGVTAAFALSIAASDTYEPFYMEMDGEYPVNINTSDVEDVLIDSQEKKTQYIQDGAGLWTESSSFIAASNAVHLPKYPGGLNISMNGQTVFEFDCPASVTLSISAYVGSKYLSILNETALSAGHYRYAISAQTTELVVSKESTAAADLCNIHFYEYDTIQSAYSQVALVKTGNAISALGVPFTFANKQQVTASLNATAAQYFELSATGKTPGASLVFNGTDGLGVNTVANKTITISLKAGANANAAQQAAAGNNCLLTLSDSYTYNHEQQTLPIVVIMPAEVTYRHSEHGSYTVTYQQDNVPHEVVGSDYTKVITSADPAYYVVTLSAPTPAEGYAFQGWKIDGKIASCMETFATSIGKSCEVEAVFGPVEGHYFQVGDAIFDDLSEALAASGSSVDSKIVTVIEDAILGDGSTPVTYTVPAGVTLLVPHKANFFELQETPDVVIAQETLTAYRVLTLRPGVTIICNGNICVAGKIMSAGGGNKSSYTTGACGVINMANGGHLELNDGANLYCWGYIKGQDMDQGNNTLDVGSVDAKAGSTIWENFELGDWRGGTASLNIYENNEYDHRKLFPFQSYAIQNVEVPMTFNYGSVLRTYATIKTGLGAHSAVFSMIGPSETMFLLKDGQSKVRTWYDPTTDLSCYELSGTAKLDALHITVYVSMSSEKFILPISNSMHIILKDCNMNLANPMMVQAGAVVEIKPSASVNLTSELYLYDVDQWGKFVHSYYFRSFNNLTSHKNRGAEDSKAGLDDAKFIVDGIFNVNAGGKLYTTAGGANIMGNHGGVINFNAALPDSTILWAVNVKSGEPYIKWVNNPIAAANLCNEDGSYTRSIVGASFYNVHGRWFHEEDKDPDPDNHTYFFTYMEGENIGEENENRNAGKDDATTAAVYSHDKTGLEARMKWYNVTADENCPNWWIGTNPDAQYNHTMLGEWHQFMATETTNVYSGSNNSLYEKEGCNWTEEGAVDENCLYTVGGVKKALVNGQFIAIESNIDDPAYHATANADQNYICFEGCNWHEATKYPNEEKAYTIVVDAKELIYIVYNGDWLLVEREDPYFFDYTEQNVKRYYEYVNGEWVIAVPRVRVTDNIETRDFYNISEAFTVANLKDNVTITLLQDIPTITSALNYTAMNTTCTLDLNGHVLPGSISSMLKIDAAGSTFTITDNSEHKDGRIELNISANERKYGLNVTTGNVIMNAGAIQAENTNTGTSSGVCAVYVKSGTNFTLNGGIITATATKSEAFGAYVCTGGSMTVTDGTVTAKLTAVEASKWAVGAYVASGGNFNATGGSFQAEAAKSGLSSARKAYACGLYSPAGTAAISASNATFKGELKSTYLTNGGATPSSWAGGAHGLFSQTTNPVSLTNCTMRATSAYQGGFGLRLTNTPAEIRNCTISVKTTKAYNYGVVVDGTSIANLYDCSISDTTGTTYAYGLYVTTGTVVATDCSIHTATTYTTETESNVRGVNGTTGTANITLNGGEVNMKGKASKSKLVYGVFNCGTTEVNGTKITLTDVYTGSAALYPYDSNADMTVNSGKFKGGDFSLKIAEEHVPNSVILNGGYYSTSDNLDTYVASDCDVKTLASTDAEYKNGYRYEVSSQYVATVKVGSGEPTPYMTFAEAWDAAKNADNEVTIKLLNNVSGISSSLVYNNAQNCTLDLNNHTIAGTVTKLIDMNASGKIFTIDDSSEDKDGKISLTKSANSRLYTLYITAGTVNLKHGKIYCKNTNTGSSAAATAVYVPSGQKFTMDDGTVESESRTSSYALYIYKSTTSVITINGGLIKGHTNYGATAGGIYNYCTKLTINGGHIIGYAYTSSAYGINQYGKSTINGGIIEATNDTTNSKGTTTAYGILAQYNSSTYNGAITIPSNSTVQVLAKARTNTAYAVYISSSSSTGHTIAAGTFTAIAKTGKMAAGAYTYGDLTVSGGTFIVSTATTDAYGVYTRGKTTTISGNPIFNVTSGSSSAYGAFAYGYVNAKGTTKYSGTLNINGGTFNVTSTKETAYGAYSGLCGLNLVQKGTAAGDTIFGQHYRPGIMNITGGIFNVKATTTGAYGVGAAAADSESGAAGTGIQAPKMTITGGKFRAESMSDDNATAYAMNTAATASNLVVKAGSFNTKRTDASEESNIEDKYTAPTKDCNYWVLDMPESELPYQYKVAEAYEITWEIEDETVRTDRVAKGDMPDYGEMPTKPSTDEHEYSFAGWSPAVVPVTADATYSGSFYETPREYTITFLNDDNTTVLQQSEVAYGEMPEYTGATPISTHTDGVYSFTGWSPELTNVAGEATYTAQYAQQSDIVVNEGETVHIGENADATTTIIHVDGTLDVASGVMLTTEKLILEATPSSSGEIIGGGTVSAAHAYFDFKVNAKNHKWYGVAVPWQVDAESGISVNGKTLILGKDFDILYYNGARRAAEGKQKCWSYVEDDGDKTLQPGTLYMIGLMGDAATIRFTKKSGANLLTTTTSVTAHPQTTGNSTDANWNGVANPSLFHAFVNSGALVGQVYNPQTNSYDEIPMNTTKMVVGQGAFVQAPNDKSITVAYGGAFSAPRRARAEKTPLYDLYIAPAEADYTDRLFVTIDEDKEADAYVIGKDLAKLGVSKQVAQMWVNRYNTELCLNTMAPVNGVAEYPLSIFAPQNGEYDLFMAEQPDNETMLYLTYDGEAIWNLSYGGYVLRLEKGTNTHYGLRISKNNTPAVTTGMDEAVVDALGETRKVLINDQVFIIRGEKVYTIDGRFVK